MDGREKKIPEVAEKPEEIGTIKAWKIERCKG